MPDTQETLILVAAITNIITLITTVITPISTKGKC